MSENYENIKVKTAEIYSPVTDVPVNFFLRIALEKKYTSIIEIGTYDGERIKTLKYLLPDYECYGLDIVNNYDDTFKESEILFARFEYQFFDESKRDSLLVCNGTLAYFQYDELCNFFNILRDLNITIAFVEPVSLNLCLLPSSKINPDSIKRSGTSYYHNYFRLLEQCGYCLSDRWQYGGIRSMSWTVQETYYRIMAYPAA